MEMTQKCWPEKKQITFGQKGMEKKNQKNQELKTQEKDLEKESKSNQKQTNQLTKHNQTNYRLKMQGTRKPLIAQKKSKLAQLVDKILPKSVEGKKKRIQQIRDVSIFAFSIGLFVAFEKQIREFLNIDYEEMQKAFANPPQ
ncbi:hypothetical protein ABPG72_019105 [Tetrahymena utriculariae]